MIRFAVLIVVLFCLGLTLWGLARLPAVRSTLAYLRKSLSPLVPFLAAGLVLFGELGLDALGSFGLADRVDETMSRAAGLVSGPFYGGLDRKGQKAIVIVALDNDFVHRSGGTWPVPYSATQQVLEQVIQAKPRAVFLDIYYDHPQVTSAGWPDVKGLRGLAEVVARSKAQGIPVLTGPVSPEQPVLRPLAEAVFQVGLTPADDRPFAYSLVDADGRHTMAAARLYQVWRGEPLDSQPKLPMETLSLDWGFGTSAWMGERLGDARSPCVAPSPWARLRSFFGLGWRALAPNLNPNDSINQGLVVACPYFDIVPAAWLSEPVVQARLAGSFVFIGSTVPWLRDQAPTPLLGEVPGVMVHAMAFDNLVESGVGASRYPRRRGLLLDLDSSDLVQAGLLMSGFFAIWLLRHYQKLQPEQSLPFKLKAVVWTGIAVLGLGFACINNWPLFKLVTAALAGGVLTAAWDEFRKRSTNGEGRVAS